MRFNENTMKTSESSKSSQSMILGILRILTILAVNDSWGFGGCVRADDSREAGTPLGDDSSAGGHPWEPRVYMVLRGPGESLNH